MTSVTFKIASGEAGSFRRVRVTRGETTLAGLRESLFPSPSPSPSSPPSLSYLDEEGDRILLSTEEDLEECLAHLEQRGLALLRVQAEDHPLPSPPAYLSSVSLLPPKALKKLEELDAKLESRGSKAAAELEVLLEAPGFNRGAFEVKRRAMREAGIPPHPCIELLVAKGVAKQRHRPPCSLSSSSSSSSSLLPPLCPPPSSAPPQEKLCEKLPPLARKRPTFPFVYSGFSPETREALEVLRGQGLSAGFLVGLLLEARREINASTTPLLELLLGEVEHLRNVPREVKIIMLREEQEGLLCSAEGGKGCKAGRK